MALERATYDDRVKRINDALAMKEPDRVPCMPMVGVGHLLISDKAAAVNTMYDFEKANEAAKDFYKKFPIMDSQTHLFYTSGKANEIAGTQMIDWPGRPGTEVSDDSNYQILEKDFMKEDEYDELLTDFTGFILRKMIPRLFENLQAFKDVNLFHPSMMTHSWIAPLFSEDMLKAYDLLGQIAKCDAEANAAYGKGVMEIVEMGFPVHMAGMGEVPYDIIADYFRGTVGMMEDILFQPDKVEEAVWRLADLQIEWLKPIKDTDSPIKLVFFPFHKGMDGFMDDEQFEKLYWEPYLKVFDAVRDYGCVPYVYTEGPYDSRIKYIEQLPKKSCLVHFEDVDIEDAKKRVGSKNCIIGNFDMTLLYYATPEKVREEVKKLLDICMPGGGYIFDMDGNMDMVKKENVEAMFEALEEFGSY